jgi:hypothetical protein
MYNSILEHSLQHSEAVVTLLLAVLAIATYLYTRKHDRVLARHQNYLSLEFESIRVFQVCVEHPEIPLYLDGKSVDQAASPHIAEKAYWFVCQVLNLFELIISYRKDKVVPDDVFATWVSWFHELGTARRFEEIWIGQELWSHYKPQLQEIMREAIQLTKRRPDDFEIVESRYDDELESFHHRVAHVMNDREIEKHFSSARQRNRPGYGLRKQRWWQFVVQRTFHWASPRQRLITRSSTSPPKPDLQTDLSVPSG